MSRPMGGRCSENIELSEPGGKGVSAETVLVFQTLAEGLQVALASIHVKVHGVSIFQV